MSEEEKAINFLQICAEGFANDEKIENTDNPFLFAKAVIEKQQKEIEVLRQENFDTVYMKAVADFKDKIREKIKEYDKWIEKGEYTESLEAQRYALNELLEDNK